MIFDPENPDILTNRARRYQICRHCGIVDQDVNRTFANHKCSICGNPKDGGLMFFDSVVLILIDHIEEAFNAKHESSLQSSQVNSDRSTNATVVVFLCILKEILLERFLSTIMHVLKLPERIVERLNADNDSHARRLFSLFPCLSGMKWAEAILALSADKAKTFTELDDLIKRATVARNTFVHEAVSYIITPELALECMKSIPAILDLYAELHNKFVHPLLFKDKNERAA
jgi:hypothetical protein